MHIYVCIYAFINIYIYIYIYKTYEETGEALLSHTLILHPLYMERKIIPRKLQAQSPFLHSGGHSVKNSKGLVEFTERPKCMLHQSTLPLLHLTHSTLLARLNVHTSRIPMCCCESNRATEKLQGIMYYLWVLLDNVTKKNFPCTWCIPRVLHSTLVNLLRHEKCTDFHILSVQQRVRSSPTTRKSVRNSSDKMDRIPLIRFILIGVPVKFC